MSSSALALPLVLGYNLALMEHRHLSIGTIPTLEAVNQRWEYSYTQVAHEQIHGDKALSWDLRKF